MRELKSIFPPKKQVVFGENLTDIKSIAMKDLPVVAEIAEKIFDKVFSLLLSEAKGPELDAAITKEIILILKNDIGSLQKLLEITTSVEKEIIQDISLEAVLFLLDNVLEVNKDFLYQNILPMAKEMFSKYKAKDQKTNG